MVIEKRLIHFYVRPDGSLWREAGEHLGPRRECTICPEIDRELALMEEILAEEEAEKPLKHEWELDERGDRKDHGVDPHTGPACVRCKTWKCQFCNPGFLTEPCPDQTENLF